MTRKLMTMMLTGTALALFAVAPTYAFETLNKLAANGVNPNGISFNRLSANSDSLSANRFAGGERTANSAGEIGRVVAVELARR
jgi:hypothetical protein